MQRTKFLLGAITGATALLIGAGITTTSAAPADVPSGVPTITTLPLLGVPLTVEVTTGAGGELGQITVNPSDGFTATTLKPNRVVFENADGTGKVFVGAGHGGQSVSVRAGALADVSGDGGWSGDVFNTGVATNVSFTIGATPDGAPDITNVAVDDNDPQYTVQPTEYFTHDGHDDHDGETTVGARALVVFTQPGGSRALSISVVQHTDEDGTTSAAARVTLGRLHAEAVPVDQAVGEHTWVGLLCDGSTYSVTYTVADNGAVSFVSADPTTAISHAEGMGISVKFSDNERVRIRGSLSDEGITVRIGEKIRCGNTPSVNTDISPTATTGGGWHGGDGNHDGDGSHQGWGGNGWGGNHDSSQDGDSSGDTNHDASHDGGWFGGGWSGGSHSNG